MGSRGTVSRVVYVGNKLLWCLCVGMFFWAQKVVRLSVIQSMKILLCSASKSVPDLSQPLSGSAAEMLSGTERD